MCGSLEGQVTTKGNSEWAGSEGTPKHETAAHPGTMCMCVYASVYSMHPNTSILAWERWGLGKAYTEHGLCPACHWSHWWRGASLSWWFCLLRSYKLRLLMRMWASSVVSFSGFLSISFPSPPSFPPPPPFILSEAFFFLLLETCFVP